MRTALLVSNRLPESSGGRAEKVAARVELMKNNGWKIVVGHAPEPYVKGFLSSFRRIRRLAEREKPDLIISINNPFHLHIHGYLLSRVTEAPWLAELRDPIYSHPDRKRFSPRTWGARLVEELVVRQSDQIVWYDGIQISDDYFQKKYGDVPENKFFKLPPIGYQKSVFESAEATEFDEFTITYAGSFYEGWIEPYTFLRGLGAYRSEGGNALTANFYGDWNERYQEEAEQEGVEDWISTYNFVPHDEIVPVLKGYDALLYVGGDHPQNSRNLPSKLWDYVGAQSPIIAIVDPDFRAAKFVKEHDLGIVVPPGKTDAVVQALHTLRNDEKTGSGTKESNRFTREHSESVLAQVMNAVVDGENVEDLEEMAPMN